MTDFGDLSFDERIEDIVKRDAQKLSEGLTAGMLRDYVQELEEHKLKLLLNVKDYKEKYELQKSDQSDIYFYLNKKLDDNYELITSLENQLLTEQNDREIAEKAYEKRIEELKSKLAHDEAKYMARVNDLEERLQTLKEFGDQKDEVDRNLDRLLTTLENERKQFRINAEEMERRTVQERDRLRREKDHEVEVFKTQMHTKIEDKLTKKTKKTRILNTLMKKELAYQSKQAEQVAIINHQIAESDRELRQNLELAQATEGEMAKRLAMYQRLIKQLNEKIAHEVEQRFNMREEYEDQIDEQSRATEQLREALQEVETRSLDETRIKDEFFDFIYRAYGKIVGKHMQRSLGTASLSMSPSLSMSMSSAYSPSGVSASGSLLTFPDNDNDESSFLYNVLHELFKKAMQKDPVRFKQILRLGSKAPTAARTRTGTGTGTGKTFPPISSVNGGSVASMFEEDSVVSLDVTADKDGPTVAPQSVATGISSWDSARSTRKGRWWVPEAAKGQKTPSTPCSSSIRISVGVQTDNLWGSETVRRPSMSMSAEEESWVLQSPLTALAIGFPQGTPALLVTPDSVVDDDTQQDGANRFPRTSDNVHSASVVEGRRGKRYPTGSHPSTAQVMSTRPKVHKGLITQAQTRNQISKASFSSSASCEKDKDKDKDAFSLSGSGVVNVPVHKYHVMSLEEGGGEELSSLSSVVGRDSVSSSHRRSPGVRTLYGHSFSLTPTHRLDLPRLNDGNNCKDLLEGPVARSLSTASLKDSTMVALSVHNAK
eukprot:gene1149-2222_t